MIHTLHTHSVSSSSSLSSESLVKIFRRVTLMGNYKIVRLQHEKFPSYSHRVRLVAYSLGFSLFFLDKNLWILGKLQMKCIEKFMFKENYFLLSVLLFFTLISIQKSHRKKYFFIYFFIKHKVKLLTCRQIYKETINMERAEYICIDVIFF